MTTFSDAGFRVSGPDDDDQDVEIDEAILDELAEDLLDDYESEEDSEADDSKDEGAEAEAEDCEAEDESVADDEADLDAGDEDLHGDDDVELDAELGEDVVENELVEEDQVDAEEEIEADEDLDVEDLVEDENLIEDEDLVEENLVEDEIAIVDIEEPAETEPEPEPETQLAVQPPTPLNPEPSPFWSMNQLASVGQRALAVLIVMGILGYGLGALRGASNVARAEFVYTLDESVPDSFLREDRRLLTQVVTFKSDAVLTPVALEFGLTVDELRSKIDVETLDLSEVLRLDVTDADGDRAIALSQAVLNQYLQVITDASPAGDSTAELAQRRADVAAELATSDAARKTLVDAAQQDVALEVRQESIQRQIDLRNEQLNRIQGSLDDALIGAVTAARRANLTDEYNATLVLITDLETDLIDVGSQRAVLSSQTTAEPALLREIDRLETVLTTIDDELSQRELAPLVASPIRELSDPIVLFRSRNIVGLQGMALGLMIGLPLAGLVAYRTRKRQLWFD